MSLQKESEKEEYCKLHSFVGGKNDINTCHDCHKTTDTYGKNVWGNEVESDINL